MVDGWWAKDYAQNVCESGKANNFPDRNMFAACTFQEDYGLPFYYSQLRAEFVGNGNCRDVTVYFFTYLGQATETGRRLMEGPHKTLILDFVPGRTSQWWTIGNMQSHGTPRETADAACAIVTGKGANILQ